MIVTLYILMPQSGLPGPRFTITHLFTFKQYFDVLQKLERTGHVNFTSKTSAVTREAMKDRCDKRNTVLSQIGQVNRSSHLRSKCSKLRRNAKCGQLRPTAPAVMMMASVGR